MTGILLVIGFLVLVVMTLKLPHPPQVKEKIG